MVHTVSRFRLREKGDLMSKGNNSKRVTNVKRTFFKLGT